MEKPDGEDFILQMYLKSGLYLIYPKLLKSFYRIICRETLLILIFNLIFLPGQLSISRGGEYILSYILEGNFLKPLFLKQTGYSFYDCSSYFKVNRQIWVLMRNIDPRTDDKMNLIALHYQPDYLICRSFAKFYAVIISFQYFIDLLKRKYPFSHKINAFQKTFRWKFRIFEN